MHLGVRGFNIELLSIVPPSHGRAVNISKEIFQTAGVPVPPGYVKIKAGGLRRVFKEVAR